MIAKRPFANIPCNAAGHFHLTVLGIVLRMIELQDADVSSHLPFVHDYQSECGRMMGVKNTPTADDWDGNVSRWIDGSIGLPIRRLFDAGFDQQSAQLLLSIAATEEDAQLTYLIEADGSRPTMGGLIALWRRADSKDNAVGIRSRLLDLIAAQIIEVSNPEASRSDWGLRLPGVIIDIISGAAPRMTATHFECCDTLPDAHRWIADDENSPNPEGLGKILTKRDQQLLLVRGPRHNGRKTLLRMAAKQARKNCLLVGPDAISNPQNWSLICSVAWLSNALLLIEADLSPGEMLKLSASGSMCGPIAVVTGNQGAIEPPTNWPIVRTQLLIAPAAIRFAHWRAADFARLATSLKDKILTSGNIYRAALSARNMVTKQSEEQIDIKDIDTAIQTLRDARLETLATPIANLSRRDPLVLNQRLQAEFDILLMRCKRREDVDSLNGNIGVRALFSGASGTGKTLSAMHVAAALGKDLYRIDLSATVNKYIGETEKALERALAAAEELDVILLLDEGDALMAKRTDVGNANDRYANLETNFLLQRIESFCGIILITTNDSARIDGAFARRMDAVLSFPAPDFENRNMILTKLLGEHDVSSAFLNDAVRRCELNGGEWKNIVLHAKLLASHSAKRKSWRVNDNDLRSAIIREYQKNNAMPPLKPTPSHLAIVG
jgi:hypothetical protein